MNKKSENPILCGVSMITEYLPFSAPTLQKLRRKFTKSNMPLPIAVIEGTVYSHKERLNEWFYKACGPESPFVHNGDIIGESENGEN